MQKALLFLSFFLVCTFSYSQCLICPPDEGGGEEPIGGGGSGGGSGGSSGGGSGGGGWSPPAPTAYQETYNGNHSFQANWSTEDAMSYLLDVSTSSSFSSYQGVYHNYELTSTGGNSGGFVSNGTYLLITGLTPGKKYYYRVRTSTLGQLSPYSNTITANTTISPPSAYQEDSKTTTSFRAKWGSVSGAVSYRLDVSTSSNFSSYVSGYQNLNVGSSTNRTVNSGLTPGRNYYYRVRAVGSHYTSSHSGTITANTTISAPSVSQESNKTNNSFRANWGSVSGAVSYRLDVSTTSSFSSYVSGYQNRNVGNVTNFTVNSGLVPGKNYYYRVRAVGAHHTSVNSGTITANTTINIPSAYQETNNTTTGFRADWGNVSGTTAYRLDVSTNSAFTGILSNYNNISTGTNSYKDVTGLTPGRNYYYRVRAQGPNITSGSSGTITAHTNISAPPIALETNRTTTGFNANWGSVSGAVSYRLDVSTNSSFTAILSNYNNISVSGTSHPVSGLVPGKYYYYRVRAVGTNYTSSNSGTRTASTSIATPSVAAESNRTNTGFRANWESVSGAVSYRLDVSTNSAFTAILSNYNNKSVSGTNHTVSGLSPGKYYYYRVRAIGANVNSNHSGTETAYTSISVPGVVEENTQTTTSFNARWGSVSGAVNYRLKVYTNSAMTTQLGSDHVVSGTSKVISGLSPGTHYYYKVRAQGPNINSAYNNKVTANTTISSPATTTAGNISTNFFRAYWNASAGTSSYRLDVSTSDNFNSYVAGHQNLDVGNVTNFLVTGLQPGQHYYFRVRAVGPNLTSENSNTTSTNTFMSMPGPASASNITNSSFQANWTASPGAVSYRLDVSADDFLTYIPDFQNLDVGNVTGKTVNGLAPGETYYYRVRAVGPTVTSNNSTVISTNTAISAPVAGQETNNANGSFTANWNSVPGAVSYRIDVSADSNFGSYILYQQNKNVGNVTSADIIGGVAPGSELHPGKKYYYRIRAVGSAATSDNSGTIEANTTISKPVLNVESNITTNGFRANWDPVPGASWYRLKVYPDNSFTTVIQDINIINTNYLDISQLEPGEDYYFKVKTRGPDISSGYKSSLQVITATGSVNATAASSIQNDRFTANWNALAGALSYELDVSTTNDFTSILPLYEGLVVSGTSQVVSGLIPGQLYYYRVRGVFPATTSPESNTITANTSIAAPTANAVSDREKDSFVASWNSVPGAVSYRLDVSTSGNFSSYVSGYQNLTVSGLNRTVTGLNNQVYYYRVRAAGSAATSTSSNSIQVLQTLEAGTINYTATPCEDGAVGTITGTPAIHGNGGYTYRWEKWNGSSWDTVAEGAEFLDYSSLDLLTEQAKYRRHVTDGTGKTDVTDELTIIPVPCELAATNYVRVESFRVPVTDELALATMTHPQKTTSYAYSDGLGRPTMSVVAQAGPNQEDVVSYSQYDPATGKQLQSNLPYVIASAKPGSYRPSFQTEQSLFYQQGGEIAADTKPYSTAVYENSPLGRVKSVIAPGAAHHDNDKKTTYSYKFYGGGTDITHWTIGAGGLPVNGTPYGANSVRITEVTTPDGRRGQSVTDGRGLNVASRKWDGTGWNTTYNVYDDLGRLRYIIPPKMAGKSSLTSEEIAGFLFEYRYDNWGRTIESRSPGAGWAYAVYDQWNRLVMSRHDGQRDANGNATWSFFKYDRFNRQVMSGIVATPKSRDELQTELNNATSGSTPDAVRYEDVVNDQYGYTLDHSFPKPGADYSTFEIHSISYFDDYSFITNTGWDAEALDFSFNMPAGFTSVNTTAVLGLATGGKIRVLGANTWLNSVIYYDERLRPIQTVSENHLGGTDRTSNEPDYVGQILKVKLEHTGNESLDLLTEYTYDHVGRLLQTHETVGNGERTLVGEYKYNLLGELIEKNIHSTDDGTSFLQSVDYRYTIQNQLKSINSSQLTQGSETEQDVFGMELNYTDAVTVNGQAIASSYDGNISSISWNADTDASTTGIQGQGRSIYGYSYDPLNRLTAANYATDNSGAWTGNGGHFDMTASYDPNGNIETLTRQSEGTMIDNMSYTYETASNRLSDVKDHSTNPEGMNDGYAASPDADYEYDVMGNRTDDRNKDIIEVHYNHLQLVTKVVFLDGTTLSNLYDASGSRLSKTITDADNNIISKTDYVGLVEYLDDEINQVFIEGGRAYKQNGSYHNEYFIGDHQGNNRVAFGNLPERNIYTATMETEESAMEESEFSFPANIRSMANNHTPLGNESIALNHALGRSVGPAKVLAIDSGDHVELEAWVRYDAATSTTGVFTDITSAILSALGLSAGDAAAGDALNNAVSPGGGANVLPTSSAGSAVDAPDAYLQYVFFDSNYNFVSSHSGFKKATDAAYNAFEKLDVPGGLDFTQDGHLFVYVANETLEDQEVYFDDIKIVHENSTTSFKVTQVNEYYPYGLPTSNSFRAEGYIDPGLMYQAAYADYDALTGNYDFLYRSYDPALGQFFAVDPMAAVTSGYSPYHANFNNPVMYTDPLGLYPDDIPEDRRYYDERDLEGDLYEQHMYINPEAPFGNWIGKGSLYNSGSWVYGNWTRSGPQGISVSGNTITIDYRNVGSNGGSWNREDGYRKFKSNEETRNYARSYYNRHGWSDIPGGREGYENRLYIEDRLAEDPITLDLTNAVAATDPNDPNVPKPGDYNVPWLFDKLGVSHSTWNNLVSEYKSTREFMRKEHPIKAFITYDFPGGQLGAGIVYGIGLMNGEFSGGDLHITPDDLKQFVEPPEIIIDLLTDSTGMGPHRATNLRIRNSSMKFIKITPSKK